LSKLSFVVIQIHNKGWGVTTSRWLGQMTFKVMQNDAPLGLSSEVGGNFWFAIMEFYKPQHIFYFFTIGIRVWE
jgi:hypothetical protein